MSLKIPEINVSLLKHEKTQKQVNQFISLIEAINQKKISLEVEGEILGILNQLNFKELEEKLLRKSLNKAKSSILNILAKREKIVAKNHYRNQWMVIGMSVFGIPIGTSFGVSLENMGLIGIGLPMGMAVGIAIGSGMDKKAAENGLQLDFDISI